MHDPMKAHIPVAIGLGMAMFAMQDSMAQVRAARDAAMRARANALVLNEIEAAMTGIAASLQSITAHRRSRKAVMLAYLRA
jgi:altronate dehydratase